MLSIAAFADVWQAIARKAPSVVAVVTHPRPYLMELGEETRLVPLKVIAFHVVYDSGESEFRAPP
ncbi:hypothetical protein AB0395_01285 [Streptosporangium sp. NPDC051023]|uniref:hypothetical protein n=1 Tax=Streptosporangium sp. NPDC051023 TaxID=3155410 RepID=UPI00344D4BB1